MRMEKEMAPLLAAAEAVKKRLGADARVQLAECFMLSASGS